MCGRKKPRNMIDRKMRGTHDLEVRLYESLKQNDLDKEEIQRLNLIIKKLEEDLENISKSFN